MSIYFALRTENTELISKAKRLGLFVIRGMVFSVSSDHYAYDREAGCHCLSDAYLTNRTEIFAALGEVALPRAHFSDAKLILVAYQRWGVGSFEKLSGDFSLVLYEEKSQKMILARDALGHRSLYYSDSEPFTFMVSNSVFSFFDFLELKSEINPRRVAYFLAMVNQSEANETFEQGIRKVREGSYFEIEKTGSVFERKYWFAENYLENPLVWPAIEDYDEQFRDLFSNVISNYLENEPVLAAHLSGGLDSSSVCAMLATHKGATAHDIHCFSHFPLKEKKLLDRKNWNYSDAPLVETFKQRYRHLHYHLIDYSKMPLFSDKNYAYYEQPPLNPTNTLWMQACVQQAKVLGIKTILTGQYGNFTISWPIGRRGNVSWWRWLRMRLRFEMKVYATRQPSLDYCAIHPELAKRYQIKRAFLKEQRALLAQEVRPYWFNQGITEYAAPIYCGLHFAEGVRHVDPTGDKRIIEFCLRLPKHVFQNETTTRLLVRRGLSSILPKEIASRQTRGMQSGDWCDTFEANRLRMQQDLQKWRNTEIANFLDLDHLEMDLKNFDQGMKSIHDQASLHDFTMRYHHRFMRAIEIGVFLTWKKSSERAKLTISKPHVRPGALLS